MAAQLYVNLNAPESHAKIKWLPDEDSNLEQERLIPTGRDSLYRPKSSRRIHAADFMRLMAFSRSMASARVECSSDHTSCQGPFLCVYLEPSFSVVLCCLSRASKSCVDPT